MPFRLFCRRYWLVSIIIFILMGFISQALYFVYGPLITGNTTFHYQFNPGQTTYDVANALEENGYLHQRRYFLWLARVSGKTNHLRAGYYAFKPGDSAWRILSKLSHGDTETMYVTIVDGWSSDKLLQVLVSDPRLSHSPVLLSQEALCRTLGLAPDTSLEGLFWPETYAVYPGYSDLSLLKRAHQLMQDNLAVLWATRADDLPYQSSADALIAASLVEKESASVVERYLIASVLLNRLQESMPLQIDPTVIYALRSDYDGHLTRDDLKIDSPYNTYRYRGLPPTPIALPSLDALMAVLHPIVTDYIYFVARGDGLHTFSTTLSEHNAAVTQYVHRNQGV